MRLTCERAPPRAFVSSHRETSLTQASPLVQKGFNHTPQLGVLEVSQDTEVTRAAYVAMFGPTVGDRVRLGDTALWVKVEKDLVRASPSSMVSCPLNLYADRIWR